jgi:hypothetical protein
MATHKDYDGRKLRCSHLGIDGTATAQYAGWDDWYYINVKGVARNGAKLDGIFCRERADVVRNYLLEETQ